MEDTLNSEQHEAVQHRDGPLLVIAGAGTGKTKVITTRLAWLIREERVKPQDILTLTFADRAAAEMETRVDELVPYAYTDFWLSTFHAFGDRVLREHALELGLSPQFRVLSSAEQLLFLRERLFDLPLVRYRPLGNPTKHLEAIAGVISRAKDEDVTPEEWEAYAVRSREQAQTDEDRDLAEKWTELGRVYACYQRWMAEEGRVDFGDLIGLTLKLFRARPAVLASFQNRFRYVMVDEFQDTNFAQLQLLLMLTSRHRNVVVVGDDDQSIFKWRGAALSNITKFLEAFPDAKKVVLVKNYRSGQEILDRAYQLIRHNDPDRLEVQQGIPKRLTAIRSEIGTVQHHYFDTVDTEADEVARMIGDAVKSGARRYRDIAILTRSNRDADPFLKALNVRGIPWSFSGNAGLYEREEVRGLVAFLRVLAGVHDTPQVYAVLSGPGYRVPPLDLVKCLHAAHRAHRSLWHVLERVGEMAEEVGLTEEGRRRLEEARDSLVGYLDAAQRMSVGEVLYRFITGQGILNAMVAEKTSAAEHRIKNLAKFFELVKRYSEDFPALRSAPQFVTFLDLLQEAGDDPKVAEADPDTDAVNVLTLHSAKGLEFPVVYLASLVSDRFPSRFRRDPLGLPEALVKDLVPKGDAHLQEERRLCYVGMTRAMDELHLTGAADYGGRRLKKVSQFVAEALNLTKAQILPVKSSAQAVIERFAAPVPMPEGEEESPESSPAAGGTMTVSFYHVDDYASCPLKYKFGHLLKIPILPHHSVVYGYALHEAVRYYHTAKAGGQPSPGYPFDGSPSKGQSCVVDDVLKAFEDAWRSEGFLSREHEEQRRAAGQDALRRFVETQEQSGWVPTLVEKDFTFFIKDDSRPEEAIRVVGRWDRVDIRDPGEIVVTDFKSSAIKDPEEAHERAEKSLQLGIYALAYQQVFGKRPDRLELYFLESGIVGSTRKTEQDLEEVRTRIRTAAQGIRAGRFEPTPSVRLCQYCVFRDICPSRAT